MKKLFSKIHEKYDWRINGSGDVFIRTLSELFFMLIMIMIYFYNYYFDGFLQELGTSTSCKKQIKVNNRRIIINKKKPIAIHFPKKFNK